MTTIVEDAFASCEKVVIYGYKNSKAEEYAKENEIEFVEIKDDDETVVQTEPPIPTQNIQATPTVEPSVQPDSTIPQENTILTNTKNKCQVKVLSNATENPTVAYEKCTNLKKITLKSKVIPEGYPAMQMVMPVGGFLVLGFVIAGSQHLMRKLENRKKDKEAAK